MYASNIAAFFLHYKVLDLTLSPPSTECFSIKSMVSDQPHGFLFIQLGIRWIQGICLKKCNHYHVCMWHSNCKRLKKMHLNQGNQRKLEYGTKKNLHPHPALSLVFLFSFDVSLLFK